jgi:gamma-glutamyltranspeptidase / glutathione hydrolase
MTKARTCLFIVSVLIFVGSAWSQAQSQANNQPREYAAASADQLKPEWPVSAVRAPKGMVVSDEKLASDAGVEIMKRGGNAIDAAVAVAFALAVVEPEAGNIGGGGFMLVRLANGPTSFIDYRETAPAKASRNMYLRPDGTVDPQASIVGYRSIAVPGTVAGMALAVQRYGSMTLGQVMEPAIRLAENGFPVEPRLAQLFRHSAESLGQFDASRRIFLKNGAYYSPGELLKQPELAATLRRIAKNGPAEFYRGQTAHDLVAEMQRGGGLLTLNDLAHYEPRIREPLTKTYAVNGHTWDVITSPPPSSGGVATIEALNILQSVQLKSWDDPPSVHWVIEAMRRVFADRAMYLADPDFAEIPTTELTSQCYADSLRASIDPAKASSSQQVASEDPGMLQRDCAKSAHLLPPDRAAAAVAFAEAARGGHTTHFSVVDRAGNAVANTYTLNDSFGSGVTSADGFLLNDEMDDFTSHPGSPNMFGLIQSEANAVGPGKRPLSSMMPTILLRDGKLSFVTGSPGGPTIISATMLSILNWMRLGMDAQAAIDAPRFHEQWMPEAVVLEPTVSASVVQDLKARGYQISPRHSWLGEVEAIGIDPATGERLGAPDPRRQGAASGY